MLQEGINHIRIWNVNEEVLKNSFQRMFVMHLYEEGQLGETHLQDGKLGIMIT